jgi:alkanesulfonate monooxygenase SsuD/methylene tetrahydromethanopterin reductase-like flavin-dependent oxidoreductase (luciferase family)
MRFGIFYEHQLPRPWTEGLEQKLFQDALDQVELADRLGFDNVWEVEHHFLEEYSHSSDTRTRRRRRCSWPPARSEPSRSGWVTASS